VRSVLAVRSTSSRPSTTPTTTAHEDEVVEELEETDRPVLDDVAVGRRRGFEKKVRPDTPSGARQVLLSGGMISAGSGRTM
jgi:hypothetical protein